MTDNTDQKDKKVTYFEQRLTSLGVYQNGEPLEDKISIKAVNHEAEPPMSKVQKATLFVEDRAKGGNIKILITTLKREIKWIEKSKTTKEAVYITRLHPDNVKGDTKYLFPNGEGSQTFYPPLVQDSFEEGRKVKTLVLTEGAFKAWKGADCGIHVIGLSSISHYREGDTLIKEIVEFIQKCEVENVVILWDGDCLDISKKAIGSDADVAQRPRSFFSYASKIRAFLKEIPFPEKEGDEEPKKLNVIFKHIKPEVYASRPKGLDDLLIDAEKEPTELAVLREEIEKVKIKSENQRFFKSINITSSTNSLKRYFCLDDAKSFYSKHEDLLGENVFKFYGDVYQFNSLSGELEMKAPEWADKILWIGDEFFAIRDVPGPDGTVQRQLLKRQKATLQDLYGKDFQKFIPFFEGFCNVPDHFNYKPIEGKFYNRYFPFRWKPAEGDCKTIIGFFKHIFGEEVVKFKGKEYYQWELGLDYIQLLLTKPTQVLPVLCLFSIERNTGKSTFGHLLRAIFHDNVVKIGNNDLRSQFNEPFADKLVAICEETLLERKKDAEFIKDLSTSNNILVNAKGQRQFSIPFFCKFVFMSNNRRMVYTDRHSHRFWILEVGKPAEDNPSIMEQMTKEIPAFLHFLKNRTLHTECHSRMWFHHSQIRTKALEQSVEDNLPMDASRIAERIKDMFLDFNEQVIYMPKSEINARFFNGSKDDSRIKEILKDYLMVDVLRNEKTGKSMLKRGWYPVWEYTGEEGKPVKGKAHFVGRPYVFKREDFVKDDDEIEYDSDTSTPIDGPSYPSEWDE